MSGTAYHNEPTPLKHNYPGNEKTWLEAMMYALSVILTLFAFTIPDPSGKIGFSDPTWHMFALMVGILVLSFTLILISSKVGKLHRAHRWKKAFLANNADLKLNLEAIKQARRLIKCRGHNVSLQEVLTLTALSLRYDDPLNSKEHTTLSSEVIRTYLYFAEGKGKPA